MLVTKEAVESRLKLLRERHKVAVAASESLAGEIRDCVHWLDVLDTDSGETARVIVEEVAAIGKPNE